MNQDIIGFITGLYMWFNQIADPAIAFHKQDLERYFTPSFVMQMNDKIITKDYETLFTHFQKFRDNGSTIKVDLPFQEIVISEDKKKVTVRYKITKTSNEQKMHVLRVIAIWHLSQDGRLERMNEVVYAEDLKI